MQDAATLDGHVFHRHPLIVENERVHEMQSPLALACHVHNESMIWRVLEERLITRLARFKSIPNAKKLGKNNSVTKISLRLSIFALVAAFLCLSTSARADAIYQVGGGFTCPNNSCLGGAYTLSFVGANSGTTFDVTLTATTPTSGAAFGDYISSVEFGDGKSIASATLTSAPGGVSSWGATVYGNLSNAGCTSGPAPNACNNQNLVNGQYTLAKANGSTYSWTWHVVFSAAGLDLNENDMHIGLQYENGPNTSNGLIVSESGVSSKVPEPSSLALLASGFVGAGLWRRRTGRVQ